MTKYVVMWRGYKTSDTPESESLKWVIASWACATLREARQVLRHELKDTFKSWQVAPIDADNLLRQTPLARPGDILKVVEEQDGSVWVAEHQIVRLETYIVMCRMGLADPFEPIIDEGVQP